MAWGGKVNRMTEKQRRHFFRTSNRRLPMPDNPRGVPTQVMKALAWLQLPFDKRVYEKRLQELLTAIEENGSGQSQ